MNEFVRQQSTQRLARTGQKKRALRQAAVVRLVVFEAEVRQLLGIPETYAQGCLLPVGRLRAGHTFRPAIRRPVEEVVALDRWDGPGL